MALVVAAPVVAHLAAVPACHGVALVLPAEAQVPHEVAPASPAGVPAHHVVEQAFPAAAPVPRVAVRAYRAVARALLAAVPLLPEEDLPRLFAGALIP